MIKLPPHHYLLELSFRKIILHKKKVTMHGEELVCTKHMIQMPLFAITGKYLRSFYHLLNKEDKPTTDDIFAAYSSFLEEFLDCWYEAEDPFGCTFPLDGLYNFPTYLTAPDRLLPESFEIVTQTITDNSELLWLEFLALSWAVNAWLKPNKTPSKTPRAVQFTDNTIPDPQMLLLLKNKWVKFFPAEKIALFPLSSLRQFVEECFDVRLSQVSLGICLEGQVNKDAFTEIDDAEDVKYVGVDVVYRADHLLHLAWVEILYALQNNIPANTCPICGMVFPLYKQHNKIVCSPECRKVYDKQRREKRFGREYFRQAQRRSRERKKQDHNKTNLA